MRSTNPLLVISALIVSLISFSVIFWVAGMSPGHAMDLNAYRIGA